MNANKDGRLKRILGIEGVHSLKRILENRSLKEILGFCSEPTKRESEETHTFRLETAERIPVAATFKFWRERTVSQLIFYFWS